MMLDFTIKVYKKLLETIISNDYSIVSYQDFLERSFEKVIILRHDVDARPGKSLEIAKIEKSYGISASYYFRCFSGEFEVDFIRQIMALGHEIGYHYEDLYLSKGDFNKAMQSFRKNLEQLRNIYPVKTVSMHGSYRSKFDNRSIWDKFDYRSLGILAEPYFDLDFNKIFYLTDTGRRWDGENFSIWDKAMPDRPVTNKTFLSRKYHTTFDIIQAIENGEFPKQSMMTFHPQRWNDPGFAWLSEFVMKNPTNLIKKHFFVK